ncbi:MAG: DUF6249 domain-containing protein [Lysobacterales bacterium]
MDFLPMLIIPVMVMLPPILITLLVLRYRRDRAEMRYRLLLQLAEKGVALPEQLLAEPQAMHCDRRRALVLLAGGLGLITTLLCLPIEYHLGHRLGELWGLGILPVMLGLGYFANWHLARSGGGDG